MHKKLNKKTLIIFLVIIIVLIASISIYMISRNINKNENSTIVATKTVSNENESSKTLEYKIKIKNYSIETIEKVITLESKEKAQLEYDRYQIINTYEGKGLDVLLKNKEVIITMTEEQFKEDIEYNEETNISSMSQTGEQREILNQEEIKQCLLNQGYTIK